MHDDHVARIATELHLRSHQVVRTAELLDDGGTVPFIARYRKEATGGLDEVQITAIRDRLAQLRELDKRREAVLKSLSDRGLLTDEIKAAIEEARTMVELEDIYLPYRPKRRTRATIARERGLDPLAELLLEQDEIDPLLEAESFVDAEKEVPTAEDALAGARDIVAEWVSEDIDARSRMRALYIDEGTVVSTVIAGKETEGSKFKDYFEWSELVVKAPSHRILAMRRGESEGVLSLKIAPPEEKALRILEDLFLIGGNAASIQVQLAIHDSYRRLLAPSIETEIRAEMKNRADREAIRVFAENLRELLMAPPLGRKMVLAIDPGFRTGCKVVCLDRQGMLMHHTTIFPHTGEGQREEAAAQIRDLVRRFRIEVIAIGNGTAGRETESFIRGLDLGKELSIEMINEAGASVYSASDVAREEFPDEDVTVRGAVSIGRRLMDPLAELVKIDPKSIGVGQYQHDVDQPSLRQGLDDTVLSCVNAVGVEINTASRQLLKYVSGLGPSLADNIVKFRNVNGPFHSREELREVPRLGPKAFEQSAGFIRVADSANPLDRSAVHPERYSLVEKMAADLRCSVSDLMQDEELRRKIDLEKYASAQAGMPTLQDIIQELAKPGRDPRQQFEAFNFEESVTTIDDLKAGLTLPGIVTNVTAFGAFVDIGVHQDGLIHISELADRFIKDPAEVVKVRQRVRVTVLSVDIERRRISLSLRANRTR